MRFLAICPPCRERMPRNPQNLKTFLKDHLVAMIPLHVDALLAKTRGKSPWAGVTRVTEVTPAVIPSNHAGQEPFETVTHADPLQGNMGNTARAGAADAQAVTRVTLRPAALGNSRRVAQGL